MWTLSPRVERQGTVVINVDISHESSLSTFPPHSTCQSTFRKSSHLKPRWHPWKCMPLLTPPSFVSIFKFCFFPRPIILFSFWKFCLLVHLNTWSFFTSFFFFWIIFISWHDMFRSFWFNYELEQYWLVYFGTYDFVGKTNKIGYVEEFVNKK